MRRGFEFCRLGGGGNSGVLVCDVWIIKASTQLSSMLSAIKMFIPKVVRI